MGPTEEQRMALRDWVARDAVVSELRLRGLWSDLHDRAAEVAPFLRAQELSAQIDRGSLKRYEDAFRAGQINVLNCSTTMETGVDIADVGVVVNTNVPPAPANYRQRVGRAGRRGEPWAPSFTFCKDTPLDRGVWRDPLRLLGASVAAPQVRLDSAVIVQRHVDTALLGIHLRATGGVNLKMGARPFFGATERPEAPWEENAPADLFLAEVQGAWGEGDEVRAAPRTIVAGTALDGSATLAVQAAQGFEEVRRRWRAEYEQVLAAQVAAPLGGPGAGALPPSRAADAAGLRRHRIGPPGIHSSYGFPVDVVTFDHPGVRDGKGPSRPLDLAVRDYSPGCEVVVDGLVHRSEGILPVWGNRRDPGQVEDLRSLWRRCSCGAFGPRACSSRPAPIARLGWTGRHSAACRVPWHAPAACGLRGARFRAAGPATGGARRRSLGEPARSGRRTPPREPAGAGAGNSIGTSGRWLRDLHRLWPGRGRDRWRGRSPAFGDARPFPTSEIA